MFCVLYLKRLAISDFDTFYLATNDHQWVDCISLKSITRRGTEEGQKPPVSAELFSKRRFVAELRQLGYSGLAGGERSAGLAAYQCWDSLEDGIAHSTL